MTHSPCAACLQAVFLAPLSPQESREGRRKAGERCTHDVHARARGPRASRTPTLDGRKKSQHCQKETANSRRERDRAVYPHIICAFLSIFAQESRPHPRHPRQIERAPAPLNEDILFNRGPRGTMKRGKERQRTTLSGMIPFFPCLRRPAPLETILTRHFPPHGLCTVLLSAGVQYHPPATGRSPG